eukprot:scaffold451_cov365-Prasinococcus_capsulatus_cf.AAC.11
MDGSNGQVHLPSRCQRKCTVTSMQSMMPYSQLHCRDNMPRKLAAIGNRCRRSCAAPRKQTRPLRHTPSSEVAPHASPTAPLLSIRVFLPSLPTCRPISLGVLPL